VAVSKTKKANLDKLNETGKRKKADRRKAKTTTAKVKKTTAKAKTKAPAKKTAKKPAKVEKVVEVVEEVQVPETVEAPEMADDNLEAETQPERRKVQRRRQIDPTTCERDYNLKEIEFMQALDEYKRDNGRMFPTCSEILEVIMKLGYVQMDGVVEEMPASNEFDPNAEQDEEFNDVEEEQFA